MTATVRPWPEIAGDVARLNADRLEKGGSQLDETLASYRAEHDRLAAVVAAVHTAIDQHKADLDAGEHLWAALKFVSAIAKAVER